MTKVGVKAPSIKLTTTDLKQITLGDFAGLSGFSRRSAFVLDKNHTVQYTEIVTVPGTGCFAQFRCH